MHPIPIGGPPVEPVTLAAMRAYLRVDGDIEDALIEGLARAARLQVEAASGRLLAEGRWRIGLDRWPPGRLVRLPLAPLVSVERVAVADGSGALHDLGPGLVTVHPAADPPALTVSPAAPDPGIPAGGVVIEVRAGYGTAAPESLAQAVRLIAARWFEHRGDGQAGPLPADIAALVRPFRRLRV